MKKIGVMAFVLVLLCSGMAGASTIVLLDDYLTTGDYGDVIHIGDDGYPPRYTPFDATNYYSFIFDAPNLPTSGIFSLFSTSWGFIYLMSLPPTSC